MMEKASEEYDVFEIPLNKIWADDNFNCRIRVDDESAEELAQQIMDAGRLLIPLIVQPAEEASGVPEGFDYKLICGFRRRFACSLLGWETIPAHIYRGLTEREVTMLNLKENLERKNLNTLEEAIALDRLFPYYRTMSSIAKELKKTEKWVRIRRHLLELSQDIQLAVAAGKLTDADLLVIQKDPDPDARAKEILRAVEKGRGHKMKALSPGRQVRTKAEVKALITQLLKEGFNPNFVRVLGWAIAEVDQEGLERSLEWLRLRRGWLK